MNDRVIQESIIDGLFPELYRTCSGRVRSHDAERNSVPCLNAAEDGSDICRSHRNARTYPNAPYRGHLAELYLIEEAAA